MSAAGSERKRNANKEGRVWQRADGRWTGRAYGPDPGSRPRYVYGKTHDEAVDKKRQLEHDLADGNPTGKDQALAQFLEDWITKTLAQEVAAGHLAQSTLESYETLTRLHIIPDLGGIPLRSLSVSRVRQWQYDLSRKPSGQPRRRLRPGEKKLPPRNLLSPRTVGYCHAILRRAMNDALHDELVKRNVVLLVKQPKNTRKERPALTMAETSALLDASSSDRLWCYWLVVLTLGLRRGEGLGLRWADIDFDARTVRLRFSIQRQRGEIDPETGKRKGKLVAKSLKTATSEATVPVGDGVLDALRGQRREQRAARVRSAAWLDADLVFTTSIGTALEPRGVNRAWGKVCERAGVPGARIHDLRHACGTYLHDAGLPLKAVQTTLRHARMDTTQVYVHALEETSREAAETMDAIVTALRSGSPKPARRSS